MGIFMPFIGLNSDGREATNCEVIHNLPWELENTNFSMIPGDLISLLSLERDKPFGGVLVKTGSHLSIYYIEGDGYNIYPSNLFTPSERNGEVVLAEFFSRVEEDGANVCIGINPVQLNGNLGREAIEQARRLQLLFERVNEKYGDDVKIATSIASQAVEA